MDYLDLVCRTPYPVPESWSVDMIDDHSIAGDEQGLVEKRTVPSAFLS